MSDTQRDKTIGDRAMEAAVSPPTLIARGYLAYERYDVAIIRDDDDTLRQQRDVLRAHPAVVMLAIDLARGKVVLLHQFRLAAQLVTGRGELVELVAGRIDGDESARTAAIRECHEEIGVAPARVIELYSMLSTPGITDEFITFFLGFVDSSGVPERAGLAVEHEDIRPFVVSIDDAIAALGRNEIMNGLTINALQWLALHRDQLQDYFDRAVTPGA